MSQYLNGLQLVEVTSKHFLSNRQKLFRGIWPWKDGLKSRLPLHYKRHYIECIQREPEPVHYNADPRKFAADAFGQPIRVQNLPIPITFPEEADNGLWGGEGFIAGLRKKNNEYKHQSVARLWKPYLSSRVFYSEILDKWMAITVTQRTLDLIDKACGFDNYILGTHQVDLCSKLGMRLKRDMLQTLVNKSMYPDDAEKQEAIYKKYEKYVIPAEEIEWLGLTLYEAEMKQNEIEEEERARNLRPLKDIYAEELEQYLINNTWLEDDSESKEKETLTSRLGKMNPFRSKVKHWEEK